MAEYLFKTEAITRCYECPFRDGLCCLASDEKPINKYRGVKTRESFCTLVEVPTHGRLIDIDDLTSRAYAIQRRDRISYPEAIALALTEIPIIVEASKEREQ